MPGFYITPSEKHQRNGENLFGYRGAPTRYILLLEHWTDGTLQKSKTAIPIARGLVHSEGYGWRILPSSGAGLRSERERIPGEKLEFWETLRRLKSAQKKTKDVQNAVEADNLLLMETIR